MPDRPENRRAARWVVRAAVGAACAALLAVAAAALALAFTLSLRTDLTQIKDGNTPASVAARQRSAQLMFETCATDLRSIDPAKRRDFRRVCAGYSTLAEAYRTQKVPPPKP